MYLDITEIKDLIEGRLKCGKHTCYDSSGRVQGTYRRRWPTLPYPVIPESELDWEGCVVTHLPTIAMA